MRSILFDVPRREKYLSLLRDLGGFPQRTRQELEQSILLGFLDCSDDLATQLTMLVIERHTTNVMRTPNSFEKPKKQRLPRITYWEYDENATCILF